jgi:hypothetical protein
MIDGDARTRLHDLLAYVMDDKSEARYYYDDAYDGQPGDRNERCAYANARFLAQHFGFTDLVAADAGWAALLTSGDLFGEDEASGPYAERR